MNRKNSVPRKPKNQAEAGMPARAVTVAVGGGDDDGGDGRAGIAGRGGDRCAETGLVGRRGDETAADREDGDEQDGGEDAGHGLRLLCGR